MARFTTDELVAATALLISGVVALPPNEPLVPRRRLDEVALTGEEDAGHEPSLIARLGLSSEQQRLIRQVFEKARIELRQLSEELDAQREELYILRFRYTEQDERRRDALAAHHVETRLALHALHASLQQQIEAVLTPAQKRMAAHLRGARRPSQAGPRDRLDAPASPVTHH